MDKLLTLRAALIVIAFLLAGFMPGTLVLIRFSGFYPQDEDLGERSAVEVEAKGRVIAGDPRAVTFGRYVTANP